MEKALSSRYAYRGRAVKLRVDRVRFPSGRETTREVVEHADSVVIVPLDERGRVLLIRQYRYSIDRVLLELPAGGLEPGESPEECVVRELREETGYLPRRVELLGGFYASPGYCTEYLYLYLASDLEFSPLTAEDTENISVVPVAREEVPGLIAGGEIIDAKTIAGLYLWMNRGERLCP